MRLQAALVEGGTIVLGLVATILVFRLKVNSAWLVLGGALVGLGAHLFR